MTLRSRLALAMMIAAVLPMTVMVGLPLLSARERADRDAAAQLQLARRQAAFLVQRQERELRTRLIRVAWELTQDRAQLQSVVNGPEEAAGLVASTSARRNGLDVLELVDARGNLLASSRGGTVAGSHSPFSDNLDAVVVRRVPLDSADPPATAVAVCAHQQLVTGDETLEIHAAHVLGDELVREIAEITGQPAALVDATGQVLAAAGATAVDPAALRGTVPLGDGAYRVEVTTPGADARRQRRDLWRTFLGLAPFALASALVVGVLLAEGIARPIRRLAGRAEDITSRRSGFEPLDRDPDEVRRLEDAFDRMLEALRRSEDRRVSAERIATWQDVARRIAHEVKNPLSPIKLAVLNLRRTREKAPELLDRALDEESATILEEVETLRRLVDEFSQFARLPSPQPVPCDPREVVQQALALWRTRIETLGVALRVDTARAPEQILADPEQLGRVLKNVIGNALDALEPVGERRLAVTLRTVAEFREELVIEVQDSGVGLDAEARRRLFEPYYTTRGEKGGTGLGLSIAYRIVAQHDGSIEADGAPGRGATITIRLPVTPCPPS